MQVRAASREGSKTLRFEFRGSPPALLAFDDDETAKAWFDLVSDDFRADDDDDKQQL